MRQLPMVRDPVSGCGIEPGQVFVQIQSQDTGYISIILYAAKLNRCLLNQRMLNEEKVCLHSRTTHKK